MSSALSKVTKFILLFTADVHRAPVEEQMPVERGRALLKDEDGEYVGHANALYHRASEIFMVVIPQKPHNLVLATRGCPGLVYGYLEGPVGREDELWDCDRKEWRNFYEYDLDMATGEFTVLGQLRTLEI